MELLSASLFVMSAATILLLGTLHLVYTFFGPKLLPRDEDLQARMRVVSPVITRETTMWKAWIGFNASHSFGAILFGLVFGYLAIFQSVILFSSPFLLITGLLMLAAYTVVGWRYWFSIPFRGIVVALVLYLAAIVTLFV